jgi:hypothetical protein
MAGRGQLTEAIAKKAEEKLGYLMTDYHELRLMAYIQFVMANEQAIDKRRINEEEFEILFGWVQKGFITLETASTHKPLKITVTKPFWDAMCELLWLGYVVYEGE